MTILRAESKIDPSSYRDPSGRVIHLGERVLRSVTRYAADEYDALSKDPLIGELCSSGRLIDFHTVDTGLIGVSGDTTPLHRLIEHPRIPLITYPYEWSFEMLRAAALAHLDLHRDLLNGGFTLADATSYNIQFVRTKPVFIDLLSIRRYRDDELWAGHDQFLRMFVNPLLLESSTGFPFPPVLRSDLEGLRSENLLPLLPWRARARLAVFLHVVLPVLLQGRESESVSVTGTTPRRPLPRQAYLHMLKQLRNLVETMRPRPRKSFWSNYSRSNSYAAVSQADKEAFVRSFVGKTRPEVLVDLGCNDGQYSFIALKAGAKSVVGLESDRTALDAAFVEAHRIGAAFTPLHIDIANLSPPQGWRGNERASFSDRLQGDAVLALAVLHHLVIGRNIPIAEAVRFIVELAPRGVIEFVPKEDPMVRRMLRYRDDIFPNYTYETFIAILRQVAEITTETKIDGSERRLIAFARHAA